MRVLEDIRRNYGRKQGLIRHVYHKFLGWTGRYHHLAKIEWSRVQRLVFVCSGNICRSPYAEHRALGLGVPATSFGLHAGDGDPSPDVARQIAAEAGVNLTDHRSRTATDLPIGEHDLVLVMEPAMLKQLSSTDSQVSLLGLWSDPSRPYLEDPYGLSDDYFRTCFRRIDSAVAALAQHLQGSRRAGASSPEKRHGDCP